MNKEERILKYINSADELAFSGKRYYENDFYNDVENLVKENQELKKHLKVPKACNLKTLEDYKSYYEDTTREQILEDTYIEYCAYVNLAHRYSELKKQLEENKDKINWYENFEINKTIDKLRIKHNNQQKEFIKYLENEKDRLARVCSNTCEDKFDEADDILQKYKEIIGDDK